ncbi:MAG: hypothetical protein WA707_00645 [Pseudolabrys sp.]
MPIYQLEDIPEEFVTPKHSTAYGRLITGTQVEVGLLRGYFKEIRTGSTLMAI